MNKRWAVDGGMSKKWESWKMTTGGLVRGLVALVTGLITMTIGFGAWKTPHIDWEGFKQKFAQLWIQSVDRGTRIMNLFLDDSKCVKINSLIGDGPFSNLSEAISFLFVLFLVLYYSLCAISYFVF